MKFVFIINSLGGGGAERVLQTLTSKLIELKHEVTVILLEKDNNPYLLDPNVKIIILKSSFLAKSFGKILFIPIQAIELNYHLRELNIDRAISFLVRANFVHCFTKFFTNRKVLISERIHTKKQYEESNFSNKIMNFLVKNLYKKADKIVPISNGIKDTLVNDYNLDNKKIEAIHNPQDIHKIKNTKLEKVDFEFDKDFIHYITLGRLVEQKDHYTLIKAFKICNEQHKNTKLLILGQGPLEKETQNLINELNLENHVFLLGFKDNPFDYLKLSDVFVFSSIFEGFGNVLVEAMACELPIISTSCPSGPSEILDNNKYGILVDVKNIDSLADAMIKLYDPLVNKQYKLLSIKRANNFDVSIVVDKYINLIKNT